MTSVFPIEGGCDRRSVRYRMLSKPLVVHCRHCRWCQRESGSAFALNAMVEADRVVNVAGKPEIALAPSNSGIGQQVARCPNCRIALWSHYAGSGPLKKFVPLGTLDNPEVMPPDVHIFTASRQPWVTLPADAHAYDEYYDRKQVWREESLARFDALQPQIEAYRKTLK